jgi:two-component system, chemotaxis family, chemotaxis protein CheY
LLPLGDTAGKATANMALPAVSLECVDLHQREDRPSRASSAPATMARYQQAPAHWSAGSGARLMDASNRSTRLNVLIVDDDASMRQRAVLRRMNTNFIVEATNGEEALRCLSTSPQPITIVICDWNMPGMSGLDLFRQVHAGNPKLQFLMLTGRVDLESAAAARKAGIVAYLVKPISPRQLQAKITALIRAGE